MKKRKPPKVCPVCDEDVPPSAKACPNCGACYESGWNEEDDDSPEEVDYDVLDLPDEVLDPEELKAKRARLNKRAVARHWRWVALGLVVLWLVWIWRSHGYCRPW